MSLDIFSGNQWTSFHIQDFAEFILSNLVE